MLTTDDDRVEGATIQLRILLELLLLLNLHLLLLQMVHLSFVEV